MNFKGVAKRINDIDIPRIGSIINVGEDELHAFMDIEAAGSGFDKQNRPKMLFEPHLFYRALGKGLKRDEAVKLGLAYPHQKYPYPKESYSRLNAAMRIDETLALESCSWGLTQILGKWHNDIGYTTVQEMVAAFADDEAAHLEATVKLMMFWKIDDDLKAHRWTVVAKIWNGADYARHGYHTKLENAYNRWTKIKDTAWPPKNFEIIIPANENISEPATEVVVESIAKPEMVVVVLPQNPPAKPTIIPKTKKGIAVWLAFIAGAITALVKYFGG